PPRTYWRWASASPRLPHSGDAHVPRLTRRLAGVRRMHQAFDPSHQCGADRMTVDRFDHRFETLREEVLGCLREGRKRRTYVWSQLDSENSFDPRRGDAVRVKSGERKEVAQDDFEGTP